jgi:hypothetical protein
MAFIGQQFCPGCPGRGDGELTQMNRHSGGKDALLAGKRFLSWYPVAFL